MGAVAVCSARSGCLRRGVVHGDGSGSAGHVGVGLGWQTGKLTFTHGPAAVISYSSTSSRKSRVLIEEQDHVVIDQRHSTLQTRQHGVVGLQQGPPELAWAARSECILQERRSSTHKQPQLAAMQTLNMPTYLGGASSSSLTDYRRLSRMQMLGTG